MRKFSCGQSRAAFGMSLGKPAVADDGLSGALVDRPSWMSGEASAQRPERARRRWSAQ